MGPYWFIILLYNYNKNYYNKVKDTSKLFMIIESYPISSNLYLNTLLANKQFYPLIYLIHLKVLKLPVNCSNKTKLNKSRFYQLYGIQNNLNNFVNSNL